MIQEHALLCKSQLSALCQEWSELPAHLRADRLVERLYRFLHPLDWSRFPERSEERVYPGPRPASRAPFVAALLIRALEQLPSFGALARYLYEHPLVAELIGFGEQLPDRRQLARVLRLLSAQQADFALDASIRAITHQLSPDQQALFGDRVMGDTQAILAWVAENNPKQYAPERFDKTHRPKGDRDCRLGMKKSPSSLPNAEKKLEEAREHGATQGKQAEKEGQPPATPTSEPRPADTIQIGRDILWGYGTGVVATTLPNGMEVVLAQLTQPFHESEVSYFHPLMEQVEQRLGRRPRYGIWDTGFDAHYVYDYYHQAGGMAYVPLNPGPRGSDRQFSDEGHPLCAAGFAMHKAFDFLDRTSLREPHRRDKYVCPLLHPQPIASDCPIDDPHWAKGGCISTIASSVGSRIRLQIDRKCEEWKAVYAKRSLVERINSQAEHLGITHPKLRSLAAIRNWNLLIYAIINLKVVARLTTA
jgi:hypothetical protein